MHLKKLSLALFVLIVPLAMGASDGRIPIFQATVIAQPGSYYVTQDFTVTSGEAVTIEANHVTLDLCGHTLTGNSASEVITSGTVADVRVTNGRVVGGIIGVSLYGSDGDLRVDHMSFVDQTQNAISISGSGGHEVRAVVADSRATFSTAVSNGFILQYIRGGEITRNTVKGGGLRVYSASGVTISDNDFSMAYANGIYLSDVSGSAITGNTVCSNGSSGSGDGILLINSTHNTLDWNSAAGNTNDGIGFGVGATANVYAYNRIPNNFGSGIWPGTGNVNGGGNY